MGDPLTRREFSAGILAAGTAAMARRAGAGVLGANDRVRLGWIGVGNRGDQVLDAFLTQKDAQIAAVCDVYEPYVDFFKTKAGGNLFATQDYRRLLDRADLDALVICTPDHWHALQCIEACAAGKDVYVEKPVSLVISEGRRMVEAAKRHKRVVQVGIQRRSAPICQRAVELIQGGAIGKVTACRCSHLTNSWPMGIGHAPDSDPPPGLDWDMWLGPAPKRAYNENRCFYKFRWFRNYSGGQVTNMGTHYLDMIQWATGQQAPKRVVALGGKYAVQDDREIPDTFEVVWEYPNGMLVTFSQFDANNAPIHAKPVDVEFRGTEGTLYYDYSKLEIVGQVNRAGPTAGLDPRRRKEVSRQNAATRPAAASRFESGKMDTDAHARNFLDCVKSRKECNCPIEAGHRATTATLLANVALDRHRLIEWDAEKEQVINDPEANRLLAYDYRPPWKLLSM